MTLTFIKKHIFVSAGVALMLVSMFMVVPLVLKADTQNTDDSCSEPFDRDCDGFLNINSLNSCRGSCTGKQIGNIDADDSKANVGSIRNEVPGGQNIPL